MEETPEWPTYLGGHAHQDIIFAIGVASIEWAKMESELRFMFGTVFKLDLEGTKMIPSKIGAEATIILMRQKLSSTGWTDAIQEDVKYFLAGVDVCLANRNHLMHSNLHWDWISKKTSLYKRSKQGTTLSMAPSVAKLHHVCDDIHAYATYGGLLALAINNIKLGTPAIPASVFPWPDKPAQPRSLDYSPDFRPT